MILAYLKSRNILQRLAVSVIALAAAMLICTVASACPGCKEAMEKQDPTHGGMAKGYYYSILFMMATPYLLIGAFCGLMYYKVRRNRAKQVAALPKKIEPRIPQMSADDSFYPRPSA
jgi:hypothetical protein